MNNQAHVHNRSSIKSLNKETGKHRLLNEELSKAKHNMQYMKTQYAVSSLLLFKSWLEGNNQLILLL